MSGDEGALRALEASDESIDQLHGEILAYAGKIGELDLVEPLPRRLQRYIGIANYLENMGDVVETGFVPVGLKRLKTGRPMDAEVREWLLPLHELALAAIHDALTAFAEDDPLRAQTVRKSKVDLNRKTDALRLRLARKLAGGDRAFIPHYRLATECIDDLKRLHTLARRIAMLVLDGAEAATGHDDPSRRCTTRCDRAGRGHRAVGRGSRGQPAPRRHRRLRRRRRGSLSRGCGVPGPGARTAQLRAVRTQGAGQPAGAPAARASPTSWCRWSTG